MKTSKRPMSNAWRNGILGLALIASGPAMAASYNIILKNAGGTALACATGGFTFDKTTAGSFATSGPSITLAGCPTTFVPSIANGTYAPGALNVVVENVTFNKPGTGGQIEPLNQGPNVEGLTGTLVFTTNAEGTCEGNGSTAGLKTYTLTFAYAGGQNAANRTYTLTCAGSGNFTTRSGLYHVRNTANPIPEPQSLALVFMGLSALVLARRLRRRS